MCFPYLTRLVSNSWHTSDGVIPTKKEGQSHTTMKLIMVLNSCHTEIVIPKKMTRQHMNSFLDHVHKGAKIVLDFQTKSKAMMETILPMIEITLPVMNIIKSAKISKPGLQQTPRKQCKKHRANHSSAVLILSMNTHMCRANHSSAALLWSK
jgi:hypothetical protein